VAELVGVSSQQIQKYETGHTTINIIKLQQLAEALKISVPDLFDVASVRQIRLNEVEIQLLESFRKVKNSEMRACILKLVRNINKRVK
jgi:transcriptional regulator with XRE-family HTH domain